MKRSLTMCAILTAVLTAFLTSTSAALAAKAARPSRCGDMHTLTPTPLSQSPFPFTFDSNSNEVYLLPSPDRRFVAVLRHGAGDTTAMGIWDAKAKRPYGDKTVTLRYSVSGVCWDPTKPTIYFFNASAGGPAEESGIFRWVFTAHATRPTRLDSPEAVKQAFKQDTISAKLWDIDADASHLLLKVETAYTSEDDVGSPQPIDRPFVFDIGKRRFSPCAGCLPTNWTKKHTAPNEPTDRSGKP